MSALLEKYSIEATAKDAVAVSALPLGMPRPSAVFVPYLNDETDEVRIAACAAVRAAGLDPVPHLSARRLPSTADLDRLLGGLQDRAGVTSVFLIAGDLPTPHGPYGDSLSVIQSGLLETHGIRHVGIAGHPEGHPDVVEQMLWTAMLDKIEALGARGLSTEIVTQFSFDAARVLHWLLAVRERGVDALVRVGIPGPAGVRTLLRYAARCGVGASASVIAKYGLSLGKLLGHAGPDKFLAELEAGLDPARTGDVHLHIFPFGGFERVAEWMGGLASPDSAAA